MFPPQMLMLCNLNYYYFKGLGEAPNPVFEIINTCFT